MGTLRTYPPACNGYIHRAELWQGIGVSVVPLVYRTKRPAVKWTPYVHCAPPSVLQEIWARRLRACNLGVLAGGCGQNPLVILDFDHPKAFLDWQDRCEDRVDGYSVRTRRGWHVYLFVENAPMQTGRWGIVGTEHTVEVKATGYVTGVPSVHETGWVYRESRPPVADSGGCWIVTVSDLGECGLEERQEAEHVGTPEKVRREACTANGIVAKIKAEIPILGYLGRMTHLVPEHDGTWIGVCPFHDDHDPSLRVWPDEGRCYCFSPRCRAHRRCDVITVCAMSFGISAQDAIKVLAREVS